MSSIYVRHHNYTWGLFEYRFLDMEQARTQVSKIIEDNILSVYDNKVAGQILADVSHNSDLKTFKAGVKLYNNSNSVYDNIYIKEKSA